MSVGGPGTYPSLLHSSELAQIIHAQVLLPSGCTAALFTIMILVVVRSCACNISRCAWGQISCQSESAQQLGGVRRCVWMDVGWAIEGLGFNCPGMGNIMCMHRVVVVGVAGTMLQGGDVRFIRLLYVIQASNLQASG